MYERLKTVKNKLINKQTNTQIIGAKVKLQNCFYYDFMYEYDHVPFFFFFFLKLTWRHFFLGQAVNKVSVSSSIRAQPAKQPWWPYLLLAVRRSDRSRPPALKCQRVRSSPSWCPTPQNKWARRRFLPVFVCPCHCLTPSPLNLSDWITTRCRVNFKVIKENLQN